MSSPNRSADRRSAPRRLSLLLALCVSLGLLVAAMAAILGDGMLAAVVALLIAITLAPMVAGGPAEKRSS